jgi:beta-1,4-mannosyl-glycoprotein beta-1,4-N-acetylglucosaminyltransferase
MNNNKIIDCITFFDNSLMFDLRFNILKNHVDLFVVCESKYDHRNNLKKLNFDLKFVRENKVKYIVLDKPFPNQIDIWKNQAIQREFLLNSLDTFVRKDDYIFFSDPDEIPDPKLLLNFNLKKKYGIFFQKCFNFKFNLFNSYETPWEGTRVCKKKDLKSIDFMRQKVKSKNLKYNFLRFDKEKEIEIFNNGGWHFNNIMEPELISLKLKTFAHSEFSETKFSDKEIIRAKIEKKIDLFNRGHEYKKVELDNSFPDYLVSNYEKYKSFIL